jgi:hypothetical protein
VKRVWFPILILLIAAAGLFYFFQSSGQLNPYAVIPTNSIIVLDISDPVNLKKEWKEKNISGLFSKIPFGKELQERLNYFNSLSGNTFLSITENFPYIASLHKSGSDFDFIFYLPLNNFNVRSELEKLIKNYSNNNDFSFSERENKGFIIHAVSDKKGNKIFYINHSGLLIASFSEGLIEDVITTIKLNNEKLFWENEKVSKEDKNFEGMLTLYINYDELPFLFSAFTDDPVYKKLSSFARESVLDLKFSEGKIFLNGYSYTTDQLKHYLDIFKDQLPQEFQIRNYLPLNAVNVFYIGFDNPEKFHQDLNRYFSINDRQILSLRDSISSNDSLVIKDIFKTLRSEIAICTVRDSLFERLVFMKSADPESLLKNLLSFSGVDPSSLVKGIGKLKSPNIPQALFGRLFSGFRECYYLILDDYVVLGESESSLNFLSLSVNHENVWGKTLLMSSLLEENVGQINLGYFINPAFTGSENKFTEDVSMVSLQFTTVDSTFLTSFIINFESVEPAKQEERADKKTIALKSPVINTIVPENGKGIFMQDSSGIYLMDQNAEIQWSFTFDSGKIPAIIAADIDQDKSSDYVFAVNNQIYALDKNGRLLGNFPIRLRDSIAADWFSIFDYDGNKAYRLIVADSSGHVYFYDKEGKNLEGWSPKEFSGPLTDRVRHMRLQNKDYLIAVEKSGIVHLLNRRGEEYPGFPAELDSELNQGVLVRKGGNIEKTFLILTGKAGDVFLVNLKGKSERSERNVKVYLLREERGSGSMMIKKTGNSYEISDTEGNKLGRFESSQNFSSISFIKTPFNSEIFIFYNSNHYLISDQEGRILASGQAEGISSIKALLSDKRKNFSLWIFQDRRLEIQDFSY